MTDIFQWIEQHPGLAAWIQALFSIVAIVFAILVPVGMAARERARRQRLLKGQAVSSAAMAVAAIEAFASAVADEAMRNSFIRNGRYPRHTFESARSGLNSVNIAEMEDGNLSRHVHLISMHLSAAEREADEMREIDPNRGGEWANSVRNRANTANEVYETIRMLVVPK